VLACFVHGHNPIKEKPSFAKVGKKQAYFKPLIQIFKWKHWE